MSMSRILAIAAFSVGALVAACGGNGHTVTPTQQSPSAPAATATAPPPMHTADQVLTAIRTQREDGCASHDALVGDQRGPVYVRGNWVYACAYWFAPPAPAVAAGAYTCMVVDDRTLELIDTEGGNLVLGTPVTAQIQPTLAQCGRAAVNQHAP